MNRGPHAASAWRLKPRLQRHQAHLRGLPTTLPYAVVGALVGRGESPQGDLGLLVAREFIRRAERRIEANVSVHWE